MIHYKLILNVFYLDIKNEIVRFLISFLLDNLKFIKKANSK